MNLTSKLKTLATIMLFMTISDSVSSQTSKFSISINSLIANYNYGELNKSLGPYKKNFQGFQAGCSYQIGITSIFSLVPELYFVKKGGKLNNYNDLTFEKSTLRISSLEIPLLVRLHTNKLYLNAGLYAGYNASGRLKTESLNASSETSTKISFGNSFNDFKRCSPS